MMYKYYWILFSCFVLFSNKTLSGQIKIITGVETLSGNFISTELSYSEYFGKDKTQMNFYRAGNLGIEINGKWVLLSGIGFQKRQMETDCLFVPSGPVTVIPVSSYAPKTSVGICTHHAKGEYSIIDIPLKIGYKIKTEQKIHPFFLVGFSPFKWVKYSESRTDLDAGEIMMFDRRFNSRLYYLLFANVSIGGEFKLSPRFNLSCAGTYKVDDKTFRDHTIGLSFGFNYLWKI